MKYNVCTGINGLKVAYYASLNRLGQVYGLRKSCLLNFLHKIIRR